MQTPLPMIPGPQVVPSEVCCRCEVCCRFPEAESFLRPYFTEEEIRQAIKQGIDPVYFKDSKGCQIAVVPHPLGEGFLCPAFDPETHHCRIYEVRPLDCRLYPFALMWNGARDTIWFGWDPKCPFLLDQTGQSHRGPFWDQDPSTLTLPPGLLAQADKVADSMESEETITYVQANPRLITAFQADVVLLKSLDRLTAALHGSA